MYLDKIEFECRGFALGNPTYDQMKQDEVAEKTAEALKNLEDVKNGKK